MEKLIYCVPKAMVDKLHVPLGKSSNILCQRRMIHDGRFRDVINENNLSTLNHYAKAENAKIYINDLGNDMFNDVKIEVFKRGAEGSKAFPFNLKTAKEDFANCMRTLYRNVEKAIKELKGE